MLEIRDIRKTYGNKVAVDGVTLAVKAGETVVLTGPSGCGKSTLLRMINRLIEPDAGEVIVDGVKVTELGHGSLLQLRRRIGFVFQHFNLVGRLTALENVMMGLVASGVGRDEARERAMEALERVGLAALADSLPQDMSGGEQQRVAIARAIAIKPVLMLWDEPTASLDPILVAEVLEVMEDLARLGETTSLIVTHEIPFAMKVADRIVIMDKGRIVEEGDPREVFQNPVSLVGKKYKRLLH